MSAKKKSLDSEEHSQFLKKLQRDVEIRQKSYRERALKIYPHVCASCGREFSGKRLRELTVHHKDHNHENNPNDGSNWELLCLYCHDHEHEKYKMKGYGGGREDPDSQMRPSIFTPFEGLDKLLKPEDQESHSEEK